MRHVRQACEASRHGKAKGRRRILVELPYLFGEVQRFAGAIALVNPVPREISDGNRRNPGRMGGCDREGRNVADRRARPGAPKIGGLRGHECRQAPLELDGLADACRGVHVEAVDLRHSRVALQARPARIGHAACARTSGSGAEVLTTICASGLARRRA